MSSTTSARRVAMWAGGILLALAAAFGAGRYAAPAKVETRVEWREIVKTEWVVRERVKTVRGPVRVQVRTVERPGGERVTERLVERGPVTVDRSAEAGGTSTADRSGAETKVVDAEQPRLYLGLTGSADLKLGAPAWGAEARYRFAGPFWAGGGYEAGRLRLSLGVSF